MNRRLQVIFTYLLSVIFLFQNLLPVQAEGNPTAEWLLTDAPMWEYEVQTGTPLNEIDDYFDFLARSSVGWCWLENTADEDDTQRAYLDVTWDTSAYQADLPGTYVIAGTLCSYSDEWGTILNPQNLQAQLVVTVSEPKTPAFSDQIFTSENTLFLYVPLLDIRWDIKVYRSDDLGDSWYDFTASEDLQMGYEEIIISNLSYGEWLGIKVEVAGQNLLQGTSLPFYIRLDDADSFSLDWEGDRGGSGYSTNPPRVAETDSEPSLPAVSENHFPSGTETEAFEPERTSLSLEAALSSGELETLIQKHPLQVPFAVGDLKLLIPASALQQLNFKGNGLLKINVTGTSSSFHVSIMNDSPSSAELPLPFTLYVPYVPSPDTDTALLLYKDGENRIMPYSYYDSKQQAMVLKAGGSGQFTLSQEGLKPNTEASNPAVTFVQARGLLVDAPTGTTVSTALFSQALASLSRSSTAYKPLASKRPITEKKALRLLEDFSRKQGLNLILPESYAPVPNTILTHGQCAELIKEYIINATLS